METTENEKNEFNIDNILNNRDIIDEFINRPILIPTISIIDNINENLNILQSINNYNNKIDLSIIKTIERPHSSIFHIKQSLINIETFGNKLTFIKDSFFNSILSSKENQLFYEEINSNKNFEVKLKQDLSNSSAFYFYPKLKKLQETGKMKKIEEKLNNQIKSLTPFQKENISLISQLYQPPEPISKEIKYYRKVKPNGDSFYISFIYQYVKNRILKGESQIISRIFNLQKEYLSLNDTISLSIKHTNSLGNNYIKGSSNFYDLKYIGQAFAYLGIIYSQMTVENEIKNAIKLFDLAFSFDNFFYKLLCVFMKAHIKKFLEKNKDFFDIETYFINSKLISQDYYDYFDKKFQYERYINDYITVNQTEPTLFIISIVPYVFDVKLNLYINEQGSKNMDNFDNLNKIVLNKNCKSKIEINILYSSYSYHIIENNINNELDNNINKIDVTNIFNFTNNYNKDYAELKKEYINEIKSKKCDICGNNNFIEIKNIMKNFPICINCLTNIINEVLFERYKCIIKEKYRYIEYYLREIPLLILENSNEVINISSTEFYFIFNENLFSYFRKLIDCICEQCLIFQKNKKIIHKSCGCNRCMKCAKVECKIITFSNFEKNYNYKNYYLECNKCKKKIEILGYASQIYNMSSIDEKNFYEKEKEERKIIYIKERCMKCGDDLGKNKIGEGRKEYKSYNFIDDVHDIKNSSNKNKILHNLCKKCNEENKKNKNIFCVICDKNHINIDIKDKDLNDTEKNNNGDEKQDINNVKIVHENKKNNDNEAPKIDQKIKVKINKNNPPSTENNYNINAKDKKIYVNKKEETKNCDKTKDENSRIGEDVKDDNKPKRNDKNDKVICRECIIY